MGTACGRLSVQGARNLNSERIQCDEIWSFVYSKAKNTPAREAAGEAGDVWTWTAMDADSKLVISWLNVAQARFRNGICCAMI